MVSPIRREIAAAGKDAVVARNIRLSGFPSSNPVGRIDVETRLLRPEAEELTRQGVLSWADVRRLDDSFKTEAAANLAYLKNHVFRAEAGLHLCAILTGLRFHGAPQERKSTAMAPGVRISLRSPRRPRAGLLFSEGSGLARTEFPNPKEDVDGFSTSGSCSLYGLQLDSSFGRKLRMFDAYMAASTVQPPGSGLIPATIQQAIKRYVSQIRDDSQLPRQDQDDMIAILMLRIWSFSNLGVQLLAPTVNANILFDFSNAAPDVWITTANAQAPVLIENPSKKPVRDLIAAYKYYPALRFACEKIPGFGDAYNVSWMTYAHPYPYE
jgi:hypothetical protein